MSEEGIDFLGQCEYFKEVWLNVKFENVNILEQFTELLVQREKLLGKFPDIKVLLPVPFGHGLSDEELKQVARQLVETGVEDVFRAISLSELAIP